VLQHLTRASGQENLGEIVACAPASVSPTAAATRRWCTLGVSVSPHSAPRSTASPAAPMLGSTRPSSVNGGGAIQARRRRRRWWPWRRGFVPPVPRLSTADHWIKLAAGALEPVREICVVRRARDAALSQ
jgi:hypothetical protein